MKLIVVTGNTGTGKTYFVKNRIIPLFDKIAIFDVNNEYSDIGNAVCFYDTNKLLNYLSKKNNNLVIIDEATAFFSYRSYSNQLNKLLQLRRHRNHYFVFIYHSLNFIPKYLLYYINILIVFQQNTDKLEINGIKIEIPNEKYLFNIYKIM